MKSIVDTYVLYKIIRRLSTPFVDWDIYKSGLIDDKGHWLIPKEDRTEEQLNSYSYFDVLILNIKKALAKVPGGSSRIATFAAALYMLREGHNPQSDKRVAILTEKFDAKYTEFLSEARVLLEDEGGGVVGSAVPTNNMGSGAIADPKAPMTKKLLSRREKRAKFKSNRRAK